MTLPWPSTRIAALFLVTAYLLDARAGAAQSISDAERALTSRNYARATSITETLLEEGTREGAELAPLYRILGLARLGSGDEEGARTALTRWLAFEPTGRVEGASDEVRSVLMEARGVWAATASRLGATAELSPEGAGLLVRVTDPASMAERVRVRVRVDGGAWVSTVVPPTPEIEVSVAGLSGATTLDYSLAFIDEYGNRVWLSGSDEAPLHLVLPERAVATVATGSSETVARPSTSPTDPTAFYIAGGAFLATAVAGAVIGAVSHAERERLAGIYNGDGSTCTGSGDTRGARCGPELSAVGANEAVAIVAYTVGGAALIGGLSLLLVAPTGPSTPDTAFSCGPGPGLVGLACGGSF